jgi:hypothetical protein
MSGFDWQSPIVFAFVLGAAYIVFRRAWRLFRSPRPGESACGSCGSCGTAKSAPMPPAGSSFVPLDSLVPRRSE